MLKSLTMAALVAASLAVSGTAQAQHVFCMLPAALVTDACLAGKERLKTFTLQALQQGDGGNIGIAFTA